MLSLPELKTLAEKELEKLILESKKELLKLKLMSKSGQLKATHKIRNLKKYIAQIFTTLSSKK